MKCIRRYLGALLVFACLAAPAHAQVRIGGVGSFGGQPALDGQTPVFWALGRDPSVSPGMDLPIGSIARLDAAHYFVKVGTGKTDWQPIGPSTAGWSTTLVRYYLLDYDGGSDTNLCWIDAAAGSTLAPTGRACKTLQHFVDIFPKYGNGRSAVVLIKPRAAAATYRDATNSADEGLNLTGVSGYALLLVRGSTDLTNSAADRITAGGLVAVAGPNGDSSYTVAAGGTTTVFSVSAGSLGAADTAVGWRVRFLPTTTTAALRNVAGFIAVNSTTQATVGAALPAAPASGDVFVVEGPGARMASLAVPFVQDSTVAGLGITSSAVLSVKASSIGTVGMSFIELTAATTNASFAAVSPGGALNVSRFYTDETPATVLAGSGLRTSGGASVSALQSSSMSALAFLSATATVAVTAISPTFGGTGSYLGNGATIHSFAGPDSMPSIGAAGGTAIPSMRVVGSGFLSVGGLVRVSDVACSTTAAQCVRLGTTSSPPERGGFFTLNDVTGTVGTGGFGIDGTNIRGATILLATSTANTVTGSGGDIKLGGAVAAAHGDFALTSIVDNQDNTWQQLTPSSVGVVAVKMTNKSGAALAPGNVVKSNATANQVTCAKADTNAASAAVLGVWLTTTPNNGDGYMVTTGTPYVLFDGAPTVGAIAYLSPGTACKATTTVPAVAGTNQKIRVGRTLNASGSTGYTAWGPDWLAVAADGNP